MRTFVLSSLLAVVLALAPACAFAATTFEVSGWMPYWRGATSTNDVLPHLSEMTEVNPFVYSLMADGTIKDNAGMDSPPWSTFVAAAKAQHVRVIPTVMTSDGQMLHNIISNTRKRIALETYLANFVKENGYDGIEIDFEGKLAEDRDYFSTFLKGLYARMGQKWVMCDIEARTPLADAYYGMTAPSGAGEYANDYTAINKYCDRVKLMTYDQQSADQALEAAAASSSQLYAPVSDPAWIEKVVALTEQKINKNKIVLGIPTYGYEYDVTAYANNQYIYDIMWVFNPLYAKQIEQQYNVTPTRAPWGEMELTYKPTPDSNTNGPVSLTQTSALTAAAAASLFATDYNSHLDFRYLVWPDAQTVADRIALAKALGLRGVAIFKLDGGEDQGIWNVLQGVKDSGPVVSGTEASSPPNSHAIVFSRDMGYGSEGEDVLALQKLLNSDPDTQVAVSGVGSPGNENMHFGPATEAAVKKFQVKYGIASAGQSGYGYVGPMTRAKLNSLSSQ